MDKKLSLLFCMSLIGAASSVLGWLSLAFECSQEAVTQLLLAPYILMLFSAGPLWGRLREIARSDATISSITICAASLSTSPQLIYWLV